MITTENEDDRLAYRLVVHGIDAHTLERLAIRFDCRRGGVRPTDGSVYLSLPVTVDTLANTLLWIETEVSGCYRELYLGVSVHVKLSWSEVTIPAEIASLAGQYHAAIKVLFST